MPAPTNPRKRALMPSTPLRRKLRAAGHHLSPVVQVGKDGITEAVLRQLEDALLAHELVKVKVGTESPEDRFEVADLLGAEEGVQVAQVLGRTVLVYRRHPEKPRFEPAPARAEAAPRRPVRGKRAEAAPRRPVRGKREDAAPRRPARGKREDAAPRRPARGKRAAATKRPARRPAPRRAPR